MHITLQRNAISTSQLVSIQDITETLYFNHQQYHVNSKACQNIWGSKYNYETKVSDVFAKFNLGFGFFCMIVGPLVFGLIPIQKSRSVFINHYFVWGPNQSGSCGSDHQHYPCSCFVSGNSFCAGFLMIKRLLPFFLCHPHTKETMIVMLDISVYLFFLIKNKKPKREPPLHLQLFASGFQLLLLKQLQICVLFQTNNQMMTNIADVKIEAPRL